MKKRLPSSEIRGAVPQRVDLKGTASNYIIPVSVRASSQ